MFYVLPQKFGLPALYSKPAARFNGMGGKLEAKRTTCCCCRVATARCMAMMLFCRELVVTVNLGRERNGCLHALFTMLICMSRAP